MMRRIILEIMVWNTMKIWSETNHQCDAEAIIATHCRVGVDDGEHILSRRHHYAERVPPITGSID